MQTTARRVDAEQPSNSVVLADDSEGQRTSASPDSATLKPTKMQRFRERRAAVGKALIAYLLSGSLLVAVVVYLVFHSIGC